jgi:chitodextrinase
MRIKTTLLATLFVCLVAISTNAQTNNDANPSYIGKVSSVEYVSSLASRPADLIPSDNSIKEAKDKRSLANLMVINEDPQKEDDYFVRNRHPEEQSRAMAAPSLVFDAYSSGSQPTDPSLATGPNHVMVVYNTGFAIYDKNGSQLVGQTSPNPAIFPSGGCCDLTVSYDNAANRWVLTFLGTGAQIAVSDGPDPVNDGWFVYNISAINDYQKLSIWSDGYYMTDNTSSSNKVWALERDAMLTGDPNAQILGFDLPGISTSGFYSPQAFNVTNGTLPAPGGAPIVYMQDDAWGGVSSDHIKLWTVDVDWNTPGNSTMSSAQNISITPFIGVFDGGSFSNLTQPDGGSALDALQATIMNQAQFRKFASHNSAVFNFVVDADASSGELAAVRWIELRQSGDNQPWSLYQEGTYIAPDGRHAWNASLAMDGQGNIGMGYSSMSGPTTPGTVRVSSYFTGRMSSDPLGTMTLMEEVIANGNANFTGTRYGDYGKIDVDPTDDQTFWYITEYMNSGRKGVVGKFQLEAGEPDTEAPTDPTNLVAGNITDVSATLTWTASTDNVGVALYNIFIDGNQVGTSNTTSFNVTGLSPLTTYSASVNAQDAAGNISGSATTSFTTLEEAPAEYCASSSNNVNDEYISRVQLNAIDNSSGAQFYSDFTSISTDLSEGQTYTITVTPTWTGTIYNEGYAVWVDYNSDADFDDAGELVWSQAASTQTPVSGTFTVPSSTSQTATRMRVSMKYNGIPTACENFTYGEVEDYTVNLMTGGGDTEPPTAPTNLTASNTTDNSTDLSWNASTDNVGVTGYEVFQDGSSIGTVTGTSMNVTGLTSNTTYSFYVNAFDAAGNTSSSSNTVSVTTSGDTEPPTVPTNLSASNITTSTATLSWTASTDNVGVDHYNIFIDGNQVGTSGNTTFNVTGLSPLTTYSASVNAEDAAGNVSGSATTSFTTQDVPPAEYCASSSNNVNDEYISRVQLNTIDNSSGAQFYSDFTSISTNLTEGQSYTITVTPTWTGTIYSEGYAVWIDYNSDADFDDAGELVWSQAASTNTPNSGTFTVPSGTAETATRMRVSMKYNGIPTACENFTYGEVEDYTVNLMVSTGDTEPPTAPTNLTASNTTENSTDLSWNASSDNVGVTGYEVFQDDSSIGTVTGTSMNITSLTANTTYSFFVNAFDAAGNISAASNTVTVTTTVGGGPGEIAGYYFETGWEGWSDGGSDCARVKNSTRSYEGSYSIRIRDNTSSSISQSPVLDFSGNTEVTIEFHTYSYSMELGEDFFVEFYNGSNYEVIGNYARGTHFENNSFFTDNIVLNASQYNFTTNNRIRFRCDASGNADYIYFDQVIISGDNVQSSQNNPEEELEHADNLRSFTDMSYKNINIYPNPTNSMLNIDILKGEFDEIMIISSKGELVHRNNTVETKTSIDVSQYAPGMYFVRFISNGLAVTKRFIKE